MAVDVAGFRVRFPEFASTVTYPDARVQVMLDDAALQINRGLWGIKADLGTYYLAAHGLAFDTSVGSGISAFGQVTQESVGQISRSYGSNSAVVSAGDTDLAMTKYGMLYLRLKRQILATPVVL